MAVALGTIHAASTRAMARLAYTMSVLCMLSPPPPRKPTPQQTQSSRPALVISDQELARDIKSTAISLWNKAVMASTHAATDGLNTAADKVSEEMDVLGKTVKEKVSEIAESKD